MATATLVRKVLLKVSADDGDTETKLDRISDKARKLGEQHPELKVRIDSAEAAAKMAVLRKELKDTSKQADQTKFSIKGFGLALASVATGGLSGGISEMSMFQKAMMGLNFATGLGEPLMAGLTVAVGGLSSGIVAAGAGIGIFGAVAKSAYSQVSGAVQAFATAQSTSGKASATAMAQYKAQMAALTPTQRRFAVGVESMQQAWQGFVTANTGGVTKILNQGMGLLPSVLAAMQPFLAPTEKALHGLMGGLGKGLDSAGFKSWISAFSSASGPMLSNLGHAIGHIVVGIGGILKAFLPMASRMTGGLDSITGKFAKWGTTLTGHSGFKSLMSMFQTETPLAVGVLKNLAGVIKNVVSDMTGLSTFSNGRMLLQILGPVSGFLEKISGNKALLNFALYGLAAFDAIKKVSSGITGVSNALTGMKNAGSILQTVATKMGLLKVAQTEAAAATEEETVAQGELDGAMDANPIGLIILAVAGLVIGIVELWKHSTGFRNFWKGAWKDIKEVAVVAWKLIVAQFKIAVSVIDSTVHWFSRLPGYFHNWFFDVYHAIVDAWQHVYSFVRAAPGKILGFLSGLPGKMLTLGENIVMGLVHGIEHMFGAVGSAIGHLASLIPSGLSKILSIFSPSKVTFWHGQMIGQGLALGIESTIGRVGTATTRLAAAALPRGYGTAGAGGYGGRPGVLQIEWVGGGGADAEFITWLKRHIRIRGGDPSVLGR